MEDGLSFDDVLIVPLKSNVKYENIDVTTKITQNISANIPFLSSAMDTVTEYSMAIEMAKHGGIGIIHKNLTPVKQASMVKDVKNYNIKKELGNYKFANLDKNKKLLSGAAVDVTPNVEREEKLADAGVDILVIDKANGYTDSMVKKIKLLKKNFPKIDLIAGNVVTEDATKELLDAGADAIKVGIGPGSICTTRIISGVGVPQFTAVSNCASVLKKAKVPLIADGGVKYSGDVVKALAAGASAVMIGNLFAGVDESPGNVIFLKGRGYKNYRGMGSISAMKEGGHTRYYGYEPVNMQELIPEGIEGFIPYKGKLANVIRQLAGGVKSGFYYCGALNIGDIQKKAKFIKITQSALQESHAHNVNVVQDAPNYYI